jgi:hypothetical protein
VISSYLFSKLDFSGLFRFVSPNFFKVLSPVSLFKVAPVLKRNYSDKAGWEALWTKRSWKLQKAGFSAEKNPGQQALRLFFYQILTEETWILDFRSDAFPQGEAGETGWKPKPLFYRVPPDFAEQMSNLYCGFYTSDDELFDRALAKLGLLKAKECLRNHFGQGDQTKVQFKLQTFQSTFAEVFQVCDREKLKLQTEFFVLGLMLLTLYQNLETYDSPQNARKCFLDALEKAGHRNRGASS